MFFDWGIGMQELLQAFPVSVHMQGIVNTVGPLDVIDVLIVAVIIYKIYGLLKDTRAITLLKGLLMLLVLTVVCNFLELHVIHWVLQKSVTFLFVALPIVFQPELRRALERLGQGRFLGPIIYLNDEEADKMVAELTDAVTAMSKTKTGALIAIEREIGLNDIAASGIPIDAIVTSALLQNVFVTKTPLHDGAAIIRGKRLIAAGCLLPLTDNRRLSTELGTRHRAGIGLSEQSDALIIVVSEETGTISIAENGRIRRRLNADDLKEIIRPIFTEQKASFKFKDMLQNWGKKK